MTRENMLPVCLPLSAMLFVAGAVPVPGFADPIQPAGISSPSTLSASGGIIRLRWSDIIKLVDKHPRMAAYQYKIKASRAAVDAAGAVPNPSLTATAAYGRAIDDSVSRIEWGLGLTIPLGWVVQRGAMMDAAGAKANVTDAEAKAQRRDLLLKLRVLFWNLVYEQERVATLEEQRKQVEALASTVRRRVEKGEVRPVEAERVDVEAEKIAGRLGVARAALVARCASLASWMGVRFRQRIVAMGNLTAFPHPIPADRARKRARMDNPAVLVAEAIVQANKSRVASVRRTRVPSFALEAFTDHELDRRAYGIGLSIDLPVWNWRTGIIRQAENTLVAERKQLEAERRRLETAAVEAQVKCKAGVALSTRYRDRILPKAIGAVRMIERTYQLGDATLLEVIDARRTLIGTKLQFLDTLIKARGDCSRLEALTGEESP